MKIGIVKGREFKANRDGQNIRLMLQVEITDSNDIHTVEFMSSAGVDTNPANGSKVLIVDVGSAYKIAIAADDNIEPSSEEGGNGIYSVSSGAIAAFINLLSGGTIEINGNNDFAIRFNEMKTAFDELKADLNTFIGVYNGHNHPTAPSGPVSPPSAPGSSSTADMSGAKVDEVKLP